MEWLVEVSEYARDSYWEMDEPLRAELRDQVAHVAEDPGERLFRSALLRGRLCHEYRSEVAPDLRVVLAFGELNFKDRIVTLLAISRYTDPEM